MNHPRQSLRATVDGQLFDVGLDESGQVSVADASTGETETIQVSDTGRRAVMTVGLSGPRVLRAHVALDDEAVWVFIDGATFQVEVASAQQDHVRRRDRSCHDALSAPMPATVTRILVEPGQQVARGDTLVLLEAMKMEMPVKAPRAARVVAINCGVGELVQPGAALFELEDLEPR